MNVLFQFLFKYRTFLVFVLLEGLCFWIIVKSNSYHSAAYFTSSNRLSASVFNSSQEIKDYFSLREKNQYLAEENARLRQLILLTGDSTTIDTTLPDTTISKGIAAKVVDKSIFFRNNYLTINKGSLDGVKPKMGVIGTKGIVGQVKNVSSNYSTVVSLLHSKSLISATHNKSDALCTVVWKGEDPLFANLEFLPRHISLSVGDSIKTSGYNSIFPDDQLIGVIEELSLDDAATFYTATVRLSSDFYKLEYVYLLEIPGKVEIDSLNILTDHGQE